MDSVVSIYKATNQINLKSYIGKTVKTMDKRRKEHEARSQKDLTSRGLPAAIRKYGAHSFSWELLDVCSRVDANEREKFYVELYETSKQGIGYNLTNGGDGASYGDLNPSKRPEVREKLRIANTGYRHTEETRKIMSEKSKAFYVNGMPQEIRDKISKAQIGRPVAKGSESKLAKVYTLVDPSGKIHTFSGARAFAESNNLDHSAICKLWNGKLLSHRGWRKHTTT